MIWVALIVYDKNWTVWTQSGSYPPLTVKLVTDTFLSWVVFRLVFRMVFRVYCPWSLKLTCLSSMCVELARIRALYFGSNWATRAPPNICGAQTPVGLDQLWTMRYMNKYNRRTICHNYVMGILCNSVHFKSINIHCYLSGHTTLEHGSSSLWLKPEWIGWGFYSP